MYSKLIVFLSCFVLNFILIPELFASHSCKDNSCKSEKKIEIPKKTTKHKCCVSNEHNNSQDENCDCIYCFKCEPKHSQQIKRISNVAIKTEIVAIISYHLRIEQKIDCLIFQSPHTLSTLDYFIKTIRLQI